MQPWKDPDQSPPGSKRSARAASAGLGFPPGIGEPREFRGGVDRHGEKIGRKAQVGGCWWLGTSSFLIEFLFP